MNDSENFSFSSSKLVVKVLALFATIMLLFNVIRSLQFNSPTYSFTFHSFLTYLADAPVITPVFNLNSFTITASWGIFNGFRDFLNIFTNISAFAIWFSELIIRCVTYVAYFFNFIFVV